jgi:hybrid cluster-associated redox disulfide protein
MPTGRQSKKSAKKKKVVRSTRTAPVRRNRFVVGPETGISEIVAMHPQAEDVLTAYGLYCHHCVLNEVESLEEGAKLHGLGDEDISNLINDLNDLLKKKPKKISVTLEAALSLKKIAAKEAKKGQVLRVTTDENGKFCMQFEPKPKPKDYVFSHPEVPGLTLVASAGALTRIGGSCIDLKAGKFTLDLQEKEKCEDCDGECGCSTQ